MKVLVTGDRQWQDKNYLFDILNIYHWTDINGPITLVITNDTSDVAYFANLWAEKNKVPMAHFEKPDLILTFTDTPTHIIAHVNEDPNDHNH